MFHVNIAHNLVQKFLNAYLSFRKCKFVGPFSKRHNLQTKHCPKQVFIFFLISVLCSITWGIACAMAAVITITSQTNSINKDPIDSISYFFTFFGTTLNFFRHKFWFFLANNWFFGTKLIFFALNSLFLNCKLNFFWH